MTHPEDFIERVLDLARRVPGLSGAAVGEAAREAAALESALRAASERWLGSGDGFDAIATGVQLADAAIQCGPAAKAFATAHEWSTRTPVPGVAAQAAAINLRLAHGALLRTLAPLGTPPVQPRAQAPAPGAATSPGGAAPTASNPGAEAAVAASPSGGPDLEVLRNIATYHREHERFYSLDITESACDLYREANKLRIVAAVWLRPQVGGASSGVDYSLPQYQAAGCEDLNALDAIAAIGVLFMEGESEPAEIRRLKARMQALAGTWSHVGQWLSSKMDSAWAREQAVYTPALIDVAQARFNTIVTNWRGSRETLLCGRLVGLAVAGLQAIDFQPAAVRRDRVAAGRRLLEVAWLLSLAAQIKARSAADLAGNDRNWTAYLDGMPSA